jgi:molybdopterin-binding protein
MPLDGRAVLSVHLGPLSSGHHPREERRTMKISARNTLKGKVKQIEQGAVNTEVTIELPGGMEIVSIITKKSAATLGLAKGKDVYAVIKASSVMIGVDH